MAEVEDAKAKSPGAADAPIPDSGGDGGVTRRDVLQTAASAAIAAGVGTVASPAVIRAQDGADRPNILFIFSDQERYFRQWPEGLSLPGHERLQRRGVTFHNHYCPAVMCTPSRSVLMTGLQTADNGMFDNTNFPYQPNMSTDIPTYGRMLDQGGYHPAYKGKWHLNVDFDSNEPRRLIVEEMAAYGFADYYTVGDIIGHQLGGYKNDHMVAGNAIRWLRESGQALNEVGTPWG